MSDIKPKLNKEVFIQFWRVTYPFFKSNSKWKAIAVLILLIALSLGFNGVNVLMSYANRDLMTALADRKMSGFLYAMYWYFGAILVAIPIGVFYRFCEERLALLWRDWMTNHLINRYFLNRSYYKLKNHPDIDNPDQRIAEDVRNFTATTLSFLLIIINSGITLIAFMGVLASISWVLVLVLFVYAIIGTGLTAYIGRYLVRLHFRQFKREAAFRYGVIRVRDHAESIAFYRGENKELSDLRRKLRSLLNNTLSIIIWNRNLGFFTSSYNFVAILIPIVIVAPIYMKGDIQFGVIPQAAGAFGTVLAALSLIITQFERLSAFTASIVRLAGIWEEIGADELDDEQAVQREDSAIDIQEGVKKLSVKALSVVTPDRKRQLIKDLNFELGVGDRLLIMGETGAGKTSLLRTIAGLWNYGQGTIKRPQLKDMMFLPQRPYMIPGTLRAQLSYPSKFGIGTDETIKEVLKQVKLDEILARVGGNLDAELDWANVLSLGEQQKIAFARLLLRRPLLAFLDESSSALDEENQDVLYSVVARSGIIYVSVGHRSSLKQHHNHLLKLNTDGTWKLTRQVEI